MSPDVCSVYVVEDKAYKGCKVFARADSGTEAVCMEGEYTRRESRLVLKAGFGRPADVCGLGR